MNPIDPDKIAPILKAKKRSDLLLRSVRDLRDVDLVPTAELVAELHRRHEASVITLLRPARCRGDHQGIVEWQGSGLVNKQYAIATHTAVSIRKAISRAQKA